MSKNVVKSLNAVKLLRWLILVAVAAMSLSISALGAQVTIDFENIDTVGYGEANPTVLTNQYQGVTFNSPVVLDYSKGSPIPGFTTSGTKAIEQCYQQERCYTPIAMNFTSAVSQVRVSVGFSGPLNESRTVALQTFNRDGAPVTRSTLVLNSDNSPQMSNIPLEVVSSNPDIASAEVYFLPNAQGATNVSMSGLVVDDLMFQTADAVGEACASTRPPTVNLTAPEDRSTVTANEFQIEGTIDTQSPLITAALLVTSENGTMRSYDLLGNNIAEANGGMFATWVRDLLFQGSNNVTVTVRDCRGFGSATRTVDFQGPSEGAAGSLTQRAENATSTARNVTFVGMPLAIAAILGALALRFARRSS